jgi:hypothetical protein
LERWHFTESLTTSQPQQEQQQQQQQQHSNSINNSTQLSTKPVFSFLPIQTTDLSRPHLQMITIHHSCTAYNSINLGTE